MGLRGICGGCGAAGESCCEAARARLETADQLNRLVQRLHVITRRQAGEIQKMKREAACK